MTDEEHLDPCGDCIVCQTKAVASLVSDEMREFLSMCVESALQNLAHNLTEGDMRQIGALSPLMTVLAILNPDRVDYVTDRLDDMGISLIVLEED